MRKWEQSEKDIIVMSLHHFSLMLVFVVVATCACCWKGVIFKAKKEGPFCVFVVGLGFVSFGFYEKLV